MRGAEEISVGEIPVSDNADFCVKHETRIEQGNI